ncbi:MAG: sulfurtransferase [Microcoleaceae cyanobacterium]
MSQYPHPELLVDTEWLAQRLDDPRIRVVEVDMSPDACQESHIPGAVFWNIFTDLLLPDLRMNLDPAALEALLSRSGITNEMTVVAYGTYPGTGGWLFWLLKMIGHQDVRVLNGGHRKWMLEGRPVTAELSTFAATQYQAKLLATPMRVLPETIQESMDHPGRIILDVRTLQEYQGKHFLMKPPEGREQGGHIPGAIHIEHTLTLNEDGTFKSFDELQELYASKGITPDKQVFPYCAIGARSAYTWFVLKCLLGYPNVLNYDGSWNEWSRLPNAPIEK